jgi:hypothetical protein
MSTRFDHYVCGVCGIQSMTTGVCAACGAADMMVAVRGGYLVDDPRPTSVNLARGRRRPGRCSSTRSWAGGRYPA